MSISKMRISNFQRLIDLSNCDANLESFHKTIESAVGVGEEKKVKEEAKAGKMAANMEKQREMNRVEKAESNNQQMKKAEPVKQVS